MKNKLVKKFSCIFLMLLIASVSIHYFPMQGNSTNVDDFFSISSSSTQDEFWPSNSSEWTEVAPEEQGLNSSKISEMFEYIENLSFFTLDSVIIVRNGYLITEEYLHNNEIYRNIDNPKSYYGNTTIHYQASVTKSLMSILIGIALQEGFLTNLNQKLYEFYADIWESGFIYGEQKKNITIEQLLTMNSGLIADWHALYPSDAETKVTTDSIKFALEDVPLGFTPGAEGEFTYSNDGPNLLSGIITNVTGKNAEEFAKEYLFTPLGISEDEYYWWGDDKNIPNGGYGFFCSPKVQAKLGILCLNNGNWNGIQIVSEDYMKDATIIQNNNDYGYLFWMIDRPFEGYVAMGAGGQCIYVLPAYDIIVGFTASNGPEWLYEQMIFDYILQFVEPDPDPGDPVIPGFNLNMILLMVLCATAVLIIRRKKPTLKIK